MRAILLNQTANVTTDAVALSSIYNKADSEHWTVICSGTFGSATVALEVKGPQGGWVPSDEVTFTAPGYVVTPLSPNVSVRAVVSGATGTTDVTLEIG